MANLRAPKGFQPARNMSGGTPGRLNEYSVASGLAENLFKGDLVKSDGNGGIQLALPGDAYVGVFEGVKFVDPTGAIRFAPNWAAGQTLLPGTLALALVFDDPTMTLVAQTSGSITRADIGRLVDVDAALPGSVPYGQSAQAVGAPGAGTQFRIQQILFLAERDDQKMNALTTEGQYAWVELIQVRHEFQMAMATPNSLQV